MKFNNILSVKDRVESMPLAWGDADSVCFISLHYSPFSSLAIYILFAGFNNIPIDSKVSRKARKPI